MAIDATVTKDIANTVCLIMGPPKYNLFKRFIFNLGYVDFTVASLLAPLKSMNLLVLIAFSVL